MGGRSGGGSRKRRAATAGNARSRRQRSSAVSTSPPSPDTSNVGGAAVVDLTVDSLPSLDHSAQSMAVPSPQSSGAPLTASVPGAGLADSDSDEDLTLKARMRRPRRSQGSPDFRELSAMTEEALRAERSRGRSRSSKKRLPADDGVAVESKEVREVISDEVAGDEEKQSSAFARVFAAGEEAGSGAAEEGKEVGRAFISVDDEEDDEKLLIVPQPAEFVGLSAAREEVITPPAIRQDNGLASVASSAPPSPMDVEQPSNSVAAETSCSFADAYGDDVLLLEQPQKPSSSHRRRKRSSTSTPRRRKRQLKKAATAAVVTDAEAAGSASAPVVVDETPPSTPAPSTRKPEVRQRELHILLQSQRESAHSTLSLPADDGASVRKRTRLSKDTSDMDESPVVRSRRGSLDAAPLPASPPRPRRSTRASAAKEEAQKTEEKKEEAIESELSEAKADVAPPPPTVATSRPRRQAADAGEAQRAAASADRSKSRAQARPNPPPPPVIDPVQQREQQLRMLDLHLPLTLAQAAQVYCLHFPPCAPLGAPASSTPARCKGDHPNCLYSLGYRRKGIWAARPPHFALLGSNPSDNSREQGSYVGLKNQGATCYVNILLQSLYMNRHFRESLWHFESNDLEVRRRWEQAIKDGAESLSGNDGQSVLANLPYHLLTVFTQLRHSRRSFVDPLPLISKLGISHTEQQDAHEFRTYLMQSLEDALQSSTQPQHRTLLQALFEGESTSVLRCMHCQYESRTRLPFVDLGVPIKGRGSVYSGLQSLAELELLEENAVYCSQCRVKRSMVKRVEYPQLPPYLNVQLMRFELAWHGNQVRKKKIADKIFIPEKINMRTCLQPTNTHILPPAPPRPAPASTQPVAVASASTASVDVEGGPPWTLAAITRTGRPSLLSPPPDEPLQPPSPELLPSDNELETLHPSTRRPPQQQLLEPEQEAGQRREQENAGGPAQKARKKRRKMKSIRPRKRIRKTAAPKQQTEREETEGPEEDGEEPESATQPSSSSKKAKAKGQRKKSQQSAAATAAIDLSSDADTAVGSPPGPPPPPTLPPLSVYSAADDPDDYHLVAVLLHKGQYANHGHYTATLKDDSGCWWSFDDRIVRRIGDNFYHRGGEVVLDAQQPTNNEADASKLEETKDSASDTREEAKEDDDVVEMDAAPSPSPSPSPATVDSTAEDAKARGRRRRGAAAKATAAKSESAKPARATDGSGDEKGTGSKKKGGKKGGKAATKSTAGSDAAPQKAMDKSKAKRARTDDSGVDPETKEEAERIFGPGGYSKDAYMLLYARKSHPKLRELEEQIRSMVDAESIAANTGSAHPQPTFALLEASVPAASAFLARHRHDRVERENREFDALKTSYADKHRQLQEAIDRRKAEVEQTAPLLQAQAIDVSKLHEDLCNSNAEAAEVLEGDSPSRFISADWLTNFLTGLPPAEEKPTAKDNTKEEKEAATAASPKADSPAGKPAQANGDASSAIDVSSDSDDAADREAPSPVKTVTDEVSSNKSAEDEEKEEKEDKSHLVVDHDVHVSLSGMDEALRTALRQLDPAPLAQSLDRIRCSQHPSKVSPHVLSQVKRISKAGWEKLIQLVGPGPTAVLSSATVNGRVDTASPAPRSPFSSDAEMVPSSQLDEVSDVDGLSLSDLCLVCARELFLGDVQRARAVENERQLQSDYKEYRKKYAPPKKAADRKPPPSDAVWVHSGWLKHWTRHVKAVVSSSKAAKDATQQVALQQKQRELLEKENLGDLTQGLLCAEHGQLHHETADQRRFVSRDLWHRLIKAGDADSRMVSVNARECDVCKQTAETEKSELNNYKAAMKEESSALRRWSVASFAFPHPVHPPEVNNQSRIPAYFLVPAHFREAVKRFIHSQDMAAERPTLDLSPLLCEHQLLRFVARPAWEVGPGGLRGTPLGVFVYCDSAVWAALNKFGYVAKADQEGIRLTVTKQPGLSQLAVQAMDLWSVLCTDTQPAICADCIKQRQQIEDASLLHFTREDNGGIAVVQVSTEEEAKAPAPIIPSSMSVAPAGSVSPLLGAASRPRRSAGRRGGAAGTAQQVPCSSSDTIASIKMELMQVLQVDALPNRQQLWWKGVKMENHRTLDDYEVVRGGEVRLLIVNEDEADDFDLSQSDSGGESGRKGRSAGAAERGFQGTALGWHARQLVQSGGQGAAGGPSSSGSGSSAGMDGGVAQSLDVATNAVSPREVDLRTPPKPPAHEPTSDVDVSTDD